MQSLRILVRGRVQGVGFRAFVVHAAHLHRVTGWVRNLPDGSVEILAQGVGAGFLDEVRRGPARARVKSVETDAEDAPAIEGFGARF